MQERVVASQPRREATKKPGECRAFKGRVKATYFEDFLADDFRAEDFAADFFAPLFDVERDELAFFAPDFELDLDFDALFLVAGDFAIAVFLSVPLQTGHGNRVSRHD
jgi:hypothetical protein